MKKSIQFLLIFTFVISCTSNTIYKKPDDLIEKDLMVDLIVDIQIANAARTTKNIDGGRNIEYMYFVYKKFGVDSARFARSNFYYSTKIDEYTKILKKAKERLIIMEEEQDSMVKFLDSINSKNEKPKVPRKKKDNKLVSPVKKGTSVVK